MLEGRHAIVVDILVKCVEHRVDRLLRASVAIGGLMMRFGTLYIQHALIAIGEGVRQSEVLLGFIRVDLFPVEVGVLAGDLRLEKLIILVDL